MIEREVIGFLESLYEKEKKMDISQIEIGFYRKEKMNISQLISFLELLISELYDENFKDFIIWVHKDSYEVHFMITPETYEKMVAQRFLQAA